MTIRQKTARGLAATGVLLVVTTAVSFFALRGQIRANVDHDMGEATEAIVRQLDLANTLYLRQVESGMRLLKQRALEQGAPRQGGFAPVPGHDAVDLVFGETSTNQDFTIVDATTSLVGGTATFFSRWGEDFVRVSTNVKKDDGSRAIGTILNPRGAAYAKLVDGEAFYGLVNILGKPYVTGYEPVFDARREVIGAYYVGYPLVEMDELGKTIAAMELLDRGFVALIDADDEIVFASASAPEDAAAIAASEQTGGWILEARSFEPWGYRVVAAASTADIAALTTASTARVLGPTLLVFLAIGVAGFLGTRAVLRPLDDVARAVEDVADGDGDLTRRIDYERDDELGRVARGLNRFLEKIQTSIGVIARSAESLSTTGTRLGEVSSIMVRSIGQTTDEAGTVASAAEEVSASATSVAGAAEEMEATIREVAQNASRAADVSGSAVESVKNASTLMNRLSDSSGEIGSVLGLIEEIAEQTNLLALNATIEAARAGDAGRGFAVVASEVKELAEQTARATEDIRSKVASMQGDTEAAVGALEGFSNVIEQIDEVSQSIASAIEEQAATTQEIGTNVTEAARGSRDISESIQKVAQLADDSGGQVRQAAQLGEELSGVTDELKQLMGQFRY